MPRWRRLRAAGLGLAGLLLLATGTAGWAEERPAGSRWLLAATAAPPDAPEGAASSDRGLITAEGPPGLFINPTSSLTGPQTIAAQYCLLVFERGDATFLRHQALLAYGVTDWLELGAIGVVEDGSESTVAGGPYARLRALPESTWVPEVAVGGILREGERPLTRRTVFAAASKALLRRPGGEFPAVVRLHAGVRQYWQETDGGSLSAAVVFGGVEVGLTAHLALVAEVSTKEEGAREVPFAAGLQLRLPRGFGLTLAVVQTGTYDGPGVYAGIGINF